MSTKNCRARGIAIDDDEICDELGLCALCTELNGLAHDFGYDEIRRALPMLEELGSRLSESEGDSAGIA